MPPVECEGENVALTMHKCMKLQAELADKNFIAPNDALRIAPTCAAACMLGRQSKYLHRRVSSA